MKERGERKREKGGEKQEKTRRKKINTHFEVVSDPAISCVCASAVNSSLPIGLPSSSFPSCNLLNKSTLSVPVPVPDPCSASANRLETAAIASPANLFTATSPFANHGTHLLTMGRQAGGSTPREAENSPLSFRICTAGSIVVVVVEVEVQVEVEAEVGAEVEVEVGAQDWDWCA